MSDLKVLDLFCGAGGLSKGFEMENYNILYGIDKIKHFLKTFNENHTAKGIEYDMCDEIPEDIKNTDFDLVIGGPPCKQFSHARGKRNEKLGRDSLVFQFTRWVSELKPKVVVMENVTGIKTLNNGNFIELVEEEYNNIGYNVEYKTLNSADYGVPQSRKRVIFIAVLKEENEKIIHPSPTHSDKDNDLKDYVTTTQAFSDLPKPKQFKNTTQEDDGKVKLKEIQNEFQERIRSSDNITYNHIAKYPQDKKDKTGFKIDTIFDRLNAGEIYKSNRFGDHYRQVFDLFEEEFNNIEKEILELLGRCRIRKNYTFENKNGYVKPEKIIENIDNKEKEIREALESLVKRDWVKKREDSNTYDLTSKSGLYGRYKRLYPNKPANTILTNSFSYREKVHPFENRGISLREGARIQSFPDDFKFLGSFTSISKQIGNAVPVLLSKSIAKTIKKNYF
ncbi:MAG: DNA cytosine methyltransferase [archaeon]